MYVNIDIAKFDTTNISVSSSTDTLINSETAILTALPSGLLYAWEPSNLIINQTENQATVSIEENTTFTVFITDPEVSSCTRNGIVNLIYVDSLIFDNSKCEDPYVYVPNAFSPNGDGENDVLYVRGRNITDLYFAIFNRWGEKVFETKDQSVGWDGYFRNRNSDPAVFDYYLKYFCDGSKQYFQKGNVTLIR